MLSIESHLRDIRQAEMPLSSIYPYTAWLGAGLKEARADWYNIYAKSETVLPMEQADNFSFFSFAEIRWPDQIDSYVIEIITNGPDYLASELVNSTDWYIGVQD